MGMKWLGLEEYAKHGLDVRAEVRILPFATEDEIESGLDDFVQLTHTILLTQPLSARPPTISIANIVPRGSDRIEQLFIHFMNEKYYFMASVWELREAMIWYVFLPIYRQVLFSPYLVTGLRKFIDLLRSRPEPEDMFIETARLLSQIVNRRVKIPRVEYGSDEEVKGVIAWFAPM